MFKNMNIRVPLISQNVPEGLHNGFLGAILCQSHPKKNSDFYLHFWPLAPHIAEAVGANGKTASKWLKKYQISKLAPNIFKSWKRLKPNAIPSFLGDVGLIKVVSKFLFEHPKCHFWARKDGHCCRKCPSLHAQKWHFGCPNGNSRTTFISPTSPKNDKITLKSKFYQFWVGFEKIFRFLLIWAVCSPILEGKKAKN